MSANSPRPRQLEDLIRRTAEGDSDAWGELYERYRELVAEAAVRVLASRTRAEDVTQSFFQNLPQHLHRFAFHSRASFEAWLSRSIRRDALDRARSRPAELVPPEGTPEVAPEHPPDIDLRSTLLQALRTLDSHSVLTVVLHDLDGYTHAEIASLLGCTEGASRARLHRAHKKLRRLL